MSPASTRDIGTAADLNRDRAMRLDKAAKTAFNTWAWLAFVSTPWERLESREQAAWRHLIESLDAAPHRCAEFNAVMTCGRCL